MPVPVWLENGAPPNNKLVKKDKKKTERKVERVIKRRRDIETERTITLALMPGPASVIGKWSASK